MKKTLLYFGLFLVPGFLFSQNLNWANQYTVDEGSATILKVVMAPNGDIVSTGKFNSILDFDTSPAVAELESTSAVSDYFILRNAPNGAFISVIQLPGEYENSVPLAVDAENNSYTLNIFANSFDFDPSNEVAELTPSQQWNVALTKYDGNGNLLWVKPLGSSQYMTPKALIVDESGNLYASMLFSGDLLFDSQEIYSGLSTTERSVLLKIDPSGNLNWHNSFNENTKVNNIAYSPSGKLYTVGAFFGTSDFDLSESQFSLTANGSWDAFMSVYNTDGSFSTAFRIGKGQYDAAHCLAFYPNNDVVMVGEYLTQIDCIPNSNGNGLNTAGAKDGSFIAKYDADLNLIWQSQIGFAADTYNSDVAIDSEGNVCTIGWFEGTANFDPSDIYLNQALTSAQTDGFISKLNSDGGYVYGGIFSGPTNYEKAVSIVAGANGAIYIGGNFNNPVDIDPSDEELILTATWGDNGFLIKLDDFSVSTPSLSEINTLRAYPNPSKGVFTIQSSLNLKNENISVYNQLGQKVPTSITQKGRQIILNINASKGIYFVEIKDEYGSRSIAKLVKE